jgi:hypothetical protein
VPSSAQRGYRDVPDTSAFQLPLRRGRLYIDSFAFTHAVARFGEGPSATVGRHARPMAPAFEDTGSMFAIEARVAVPISVTEGGAPDVGVTQVSFLYYAQDTTTGTLLAHVIGLLDSRAPAWPARATSSSATTGSRHSPARRSRPPPATARRCDSCACRASRRRCVTGGLE